MKAITVESLCKRFGDVVAVDSISFEVEQGEIFGFLGPNGAGKTTTIQMLCTLLKPTSGTASINGYNVVREKDKVRDSIGVVFQDPTLDNRLTGRENLEFHRLLYDVPKDVARRRIEEVVRMVGLEKRLDDLVETYSGGMKRRLEIARGLLHHPHVLFLDEPTLGLDPQTRNLIWRYIFELRKSENITIFMTTHYMDEAENCDRIAIIDGGKIIAIGTPNELKAKVGGDIISLKTADDELAARLISEKHGIKARLNEEGLSFEVEQGEKFIPKLFSEDNLQITSISLRKPTLDDVFLSLTGRKIRDESPDRRFGAARMRRWSH